jgi:hypothetical protein
MQKPCGHSEVTYAQSFEGEGGIMVGERRGMKRVDPTLAEMKKCVCTNSMCVRA